MKPPVSPQDGLRPATQARLLLRWVAIAAIVILIVLAYFLLGAPAGAGFGVNG